VNPIRTTGCIVGGGPAGVMLGYLLARAGVEVVVLEKHRDFIRDFRGDTVHPSTLQLMKQLGLLEDFLRLPHRKVEHVRATFGGQTVETASLHGLNIDTPFVVLMPQWDFLSFLTEKAKRYPEFHILMEHEATDLVIANGRITGVVVQSPDGETQIDAGLVVACDGRHSLLRQKAQLPLRDYGVPIDVLWFRLSRKPDDPGEQVLGNVNYGKLLILIDRGDYYQAGFLIHKDSFAEVRQQGLEAFRQSLAEIVPWLGDRVGEIAGWDQVKLLSVQINRLEQWSRPGLLSIGDAAHAMSPVFGVGINLAIQDAVASANLLARPLRSGENPDPILPQVQKRREFPARGTQRMQVVVHAGLSWVFRHHGPMQPPPLMKLMTRLPGMQRRVARLVGIGLRPESIETPDIHQP
jgi:2-polyprenyl-6-methoxyphenol hydroxylase-like FAD-dependent oxidoreductase